MFTLWLYALFVLVLSVRHRRYDLVLSDQLAAINPLLYWLAKDKLIFYCHFPEPLLRRPASDNDLLYQTYRQVLDGLDHAGMPYADLILCNSRFTQSKFKVVYGSHVESKILYPCVSRDIHPSNGGFEGMDMTKIVEHTCASMRINRYLLSLNRFEVKKRHERAIKALFQYYKSGGSTALTLICCGGCLPSERSYLQTLKTLSHDLAHKNGLLCRYCHDQHSVHFVTNCSDLARRYLLQRCFATIYTPSLEHFGIVPLESMSYGCPVIAVKSGGPQETVIDDKTGYLVEDGPNLEADMASRIDRIMTNTRSMAIDCRSQAKEFSFENFTIIVRRYLG